MDSNQNFGLSSQAERTARVRRLSRRVMAVLDHDRVWSEPMGEIAAEAAVAHCVESLLRAGERDDHLIMQHVMETVCNGRITPVLKSYLAKADDRSWHAPT